MRRLGGGHNHPGGGQPPTAVLGTAGPGNHLAHVAHGRTRTAIQIDSVLAVVPEQDIGAPRDGDAKAVANPAPIDNQHQCRTILGLPDGGPGLDSHAKGAIDMLFPVQDSDGLTLPPEF